MNRAIVDEKVLSSAIKIITPVTAQKPVVPILAHIVANFSKNKCSLVGGDSYRFARLEIPVIESSGEFSITRLPTHFFV